MEKKKRSSLRKPLIGNSPTTSQKQSSRRRISFNSKKSIREFRQEEMIILEDYEVSDINSETGASPKSNQKIIKTKTTLILEESKPTVDDNISIPSIRGSLESVNKSMPTFSNFECTADITLLNSEQHLQKKSKEMPLNSKMEVMVHENDTTLWSSSSYENNKKIHVNVWESSDALLNSIPRDHQQNRHMQEAIEENPFEETPTASGNLLEEIHRIYKRDLSDTPPSDGIQKLLASIKNEELKEISSNQIESINKVKLSQQSEMFAYRALSSELNESLKSLTKQSLTVPTEIVTKTKTNCKSDEPNKLRFSQADETLLENTTFLAQVKLGDETIDFGNISSKRSLAGSQRISEDTDLSCETLSTGDIAKKKAEKNTIIFSVNKDNLHLKQNFKGLSNVNILPSLDCNMEYESGLEMKCQPAKVRKTIILHENIQDEEATVPRVLSQASDVPTDNKHSELAIKIYNKNCTRSRKTKILNKSINDTEDAQAERAKTRKKYSTSSQTMMLNESIKIDDSTLPIESLPFRKTATTTEATTKQCEIIDQNEEYAKSRRTLMLHESIEADKTGSFSVYSHGAIHKDKCEKGKYARGSLRRIEPMDVQTEDIINKNSLQQTKNKLQNESYTTLSKSFAFECKVLDEIPFTRDEQLVTSKRNKEYAKIRKTMILHEDIVEEMKADQLGSLRESSSKNENINADVVAGGEHAEKIGTTKKVAKHRQTIVFNDNIEDDVTIVPTKNLPGAISKDKNISETYEQSNYHVKGNQSTTLNKNKKADTAVKCKITDENIKREKNCIKGRQTIVFNENIEMDATTVSSGSMPSKNKLTAEECLSSYVQSDITERDKTYAQSRRENLECGIEDVASKYSQRAITKGICKKEKRNHLDKSIYEIEPMDIEMECSTNKISPKQNEIEYSTLSKTFASKYKASDDLRSTNEEQPKGNVKIRKTLILNEDIVEDVKADSMQSLFGSFFKSENITREVCTSSEKSKKTDYDKSVAREGQTVMQHDSTENYKRQISARSLCGMIFKDEVKSETCLHSDKQLGKVQGEINSVKNRQTMILNEIIEDDITKEFPDRTCSVASKDKTNYEQQSGIGQCKKKFRGKQTMMLNENIEKELTTGPTGLQSSTSKYKIAEQGDVYLKGRNVTISNESMLEEPKAELPKGPYSLTSKYQSTEQDNVNVKERKTLILNENIENDPTLSSNAAYKYKIINEVLVSNEEQPATINQHQQRSKIRKTMILHEDIEDEMKAVQLGSLNQPCFKNEKISEDTFANSDQFENAGNDANLVEAGQTMILHENDKVNAIEAARSLHGTTFKDKTTSQMCVLSHEQVGRFLGEKSHVKGRQKVMLNEIVEVDKENNFSNCRSDVISTDKTISKEEPLAISPKDPYSFTSKYLSTERDNVNVKERKTLILNENIVNDATLSTNAASKYKIINEVLVSNEEQPATINQHQQRSKIRKTMILHEDIEDEMKAVQLGSLNHPCFKNEKISEDTFANSDQFENAGNDANLVEAGQTMILHENDKVNAIEAARSLHGTTFKDKTTSQMCVLSHEQVGRFLGEKSHVKGRQKVMLNEIVEVDKENDCSNCRSDVISTDKTISKKEPLAISPKDPYSFASKYLSTERDNVNVKERKTLILNENIENDATLSTNAASKYKIINEVLVSNEEQPATINQHQQRSKIRRTMILHEDIEDEMKAVQLGSLNQPCFKNEKISEDTFANSEQFENAGNDVNLFEAGQTMMQHENDKVNAIEAARSLHGTTFKDKTTSQMCVLSHEHVGRFLGEKSHVKGRQKVMFNEIVEVDKENDFSNCRSDVISTDKTISKKEPLAISPKDPYSFTSKYLSTERDNVNVKERKTLILNENIVNDATLSTNAASKYKIINEVLVSNEEQPATINHHQQSSKIRKTMILHEDIEDEMKAVQLGSLNQPCFKNEKISEDTFANSEQFENAGNDVNLVEAGQTMMQHENDKLNAIEAARSLYGTTFKDKTTPEMCVLSHEQVGRFLGEKSHVKGRQKVMLNEIVEVDKENDFSNCRSDVISTDKAISKKEPLAISPKDPYSFASKYLSTERDNVNVKERKTLILNENIVNDATLSTNAASKYKIINEVLVSNEEQPATINQHQQSSKIRKTMILHEDIEDEMKAVQLGSLNQPCFKNEKISEVTFSNSEQFENAGNVVNPVEAGQTMMQHENDKVNAIEAARSLYGTTFKDKTTSEMCVLSHEQVGRFLGEKSHVKGRQKVMLNEIVEVDKENDFSNCRSGVISTDKTISKEEPLAVLPKGPYSVTSKYLSAERDNVNVKERKTLILNENIENDATLSTNAASKYKIINEVLVSNEEQPATINQHQQSSKIRKTMILHEDIEDEMKAVQLGSLNQPCFKNEKISEVTFSNSEQFENAGNNVNLVEAGQSMMQHENDKVNAIEAARSLHGTTFKDKTTSQMCVLSHEHVGRFLGEKSHVKGRQKVMLNEIVEVDKENDFSNCRSDVISTDKTISKKEPLAISPKDPYSFTSKYLSTERDNVNVKERKTLILNENIVNDATLSTNAASKYKIINEVLVSNEEQPATINQHQQSSKIRKTMILHEDIEDEMKAVQLGSLNQPCFKNEKISEDTFANSEQFENAGNDVNLVEAGQTMMQHENDKVNAIEAARSLHGTTFKDKTTSQMCVLSHEQVGRFLGENSHVKGKQKMMLSEIVEVDKENDFSNCRRGTISTDKPISEDHFPSDEQYGIMKQQKKYIKGRQTMIYNETIEDDEKVVPLNRMRILKTNVTTRINDQQLERIEQSSKKNVKGKKSTVFNENIEKNITESLHGDTSTDKCANEIHRPRCKQTKVINRDKKKYFTRRQTEILHDNIEEDTMGKYGDISKEKAEPLAKKSRESIYSVESMDIEMECTSFKTPSQELKDKLTNQLYSTPSKTCANQERLRRMYAMTPRRSLLEFTRLERTILKECNTTHVEFASMNNESQTFKIKSLKDNFNMDMSGLELNDSNITDWRSAKKLSSTQTQSLAELSRDTVNLRMSTLFNEAFGNLSKSNNLSIQDVRRQKTLCFNSVTDINLDNLNDIQDTSITKSNISKYFINHTQLSTPNFSNNLALPQLQYTDNGRLSDEEPIPLASTIKDSNNADDTEFLNEIQITLVDNHERCDKESSCKLFSGSNCNNATYTKICRKCQQCQRPLTSNDNNDDTCSSPIITNLPPISLKISPLDDIYKKLDALQKRTRLRDIDNLWYQMSLNNMKNKANLSELQLEIDKIGKVDDVPRMWMKYKDEMAQFEKKVAQKYEKTKPSIPVVDQLENLLGVSNLSQWFFDHDFEMSGIYIFTNRLSSTFKLKILFDAICPLGTKIRINKIQYGHRIEQNIWKPIDFILDVQLRLKHQEGMLLSLCEGHEAADIYDMLQTLQQSIESVLKLGNELQRIVIKHNALLKRDGLYRYFLHKVVRRIVPSPETYDRVEKIEFEINILNIRDVNYRNIVKPRLHNFQEMIQLLPVGLDFLNVFLVDPLKFLKPDLIDSLFN